MLRIDQLVLSSAVICCVQGGQQVFEVNMQISHRTVSALLQHTPGRSSTSLSICSVVTCHCMTVRTLASTEFMGMPQFSAQTAL